MARRQRAFLTNLANDVKTTLMETPQRLEAVVHNETVMSAIGAAGVLTGYDYYTQGNVGLAEFTGHALTTLAVGALAGSAKNMVAKSSQVDSAIVKGSAAFVMRGIVEIILTYADIKKTLDWQDLLVVCAVTGVGFAMGDFMFRQLKLKTHEAKE